MEFGEHFNWQLCDGRHAAVGRVLDGNNQLCGATYAEIYAMDGGKNETYIAATRAE